MIPGVLTDSPKVSPDVLRFLSGVLTPPARFEQLVLSWNAGIGDAGFSFFSVRVKAGGIRWSTWFSAGTCPPRAYRPRSFDPLYGRMVVDELKLRRPCVAVQYAISSDAGIGPSTKVFISYARAQTQPDESPPPEVPPLTVPFYCQFSPRDLPDETVRAAGACAPTSTAMVLSYYGTRVEPLDVASRAYDPQHKIFGNWPYLAAAAASFGFEAYVTHVGSWAEIAGWLREGIPPVLSIAWEEGELPGAPIRRSSGHLLVVAGIGPSGMTCYDPAAEQVPVCYPWREFGRIFWGHGGVAIIIKPP
jgi:hypothetical protein